jgi:DNA helicase-2/ATP-dependent DNA helicase PcrA
MSNMNSYYEAYASAYNNLNEAQRTAVDAIEGPVMVVAGPGTGKTQILSVRIGNILQKTDAMPENILCLTYTDAGTVAMRNRLLSFLGPDAYRVHVQTFHGFCNEVIQSNMEFFGRRDLDLVSDLERVVMVETILQGLPPQHVLRKFKGDLSNDTSKLSDLFRRMKEEDWTPAHINQAIDSYLNDLPNRDNYIYKKGNSKTGVKAGDLKQDQINKETERMEKLRAAAALFPAFQQLMKDAGRYDYSDMILWVVQAFRNNTDLLRNYQERFLYILVDEYQDTNGAQNELLQMLINYWDVPNVFVVGDDDQSIYEFQGARVKNILDLYKTYAGDMVTVVLTDNYRSVQPVLDASKALIDHNQDRLINHIPGLSKNLKSCGPDVMSVHNPPELRRYPNQLQEDAGILREIQALIASGVSPSEIAVIYHRHAQADNLLTLFSKSSTPFVVRKRLNAMDEPLIRQVLSVLELVGTEYSAPGTGSHLLFELMYFPFFHIHRMDILSIAAYLQSKRNAMSWRELITDPDVQKLVKLRDPDSLQKLDKNINHWISEAASLTLPMLLEKIVNDGGVLKYVVQHPDQFYLLEVLNTLFDFVKAESSRNPTMRIPDLLELFNQMRTHKIELPVQRTIHSKEGVQFITCHSAKGLEFDYVFLLGCTKNKWEKAQGNNFQFSFPDTLTFSNESNVEEALRRLFYVAMTRARKHLFISYGQADNSGKDLEPTRFIAELQGTTPVMKKDVVLNEVDMAAVQLLALTAMPEPVADLFDEAFLRSKVEHLSVSASVLNSFLDCPIRFYFSYLLKVPQAKSDSMQFGNAIHSALQKFFNDVQSRGSFAPLTFLLDEFRYQMRNNKDAFTDKQFKNRMEYGELILPEYYNHYVHTWNKVVVTEFDIRNVNWNQIPLNGKLDKLEFEGQQVTVVDYKTGNVVYAKDKLAAPNDKNPLGGDYWRQMVFYRILMEQQRQKPWRMVAGEFDFVEKDSETGKFVKKRIPIHDQDIAIVKGQIEEVYNRIQGLDFTRGCGKEECYYCNLLRAE